MHRALPGILIGGVAGTVVRWAIGEIGWSTNATLLIVNTLGCAGLGAVVAIYADAEHRIRLTAGLGFCGGLTTFSGLAVQLAGQVDAGAAGDAAGLIAASVGLGLGAFAAGNKAVGR